MDANLERRRIVPRFHEDALFVCVWHAFHAFKKNRDERRHKRIFQVDTGRTNKGQRLKDVPHLADTSDREDHGAERDRGNRENEKEDKGKLQSKTEKDEKRSGAGSDTGVLKLGYE